MDSATVQHVTFCPFSFFSSTLAGVAFVVGQDTAERLVMEKYYGGTTQGLQSAFESVAKAGCSFIVAGRVNDDSGTQSTQRHITSNQV